MDPWIAITLGLTVLVIVIAAIAFRNARAMTGSLAAVRRLQAEAALHDDEIVEGVREQESLMQAVGSGVLRLDPGLRVTAANTVSHTLLGRAPGTLVGRSVMEAFLDASVAE